MPATRQLCPRCFATFTPDSSGESTCPRCAVLGERPAAPMPRASARLAGTTEAPASTSWFARELADAREWCRGESPWWRLGLLGYCAWTVARHVRSDESYRSLFDGLNFGVHELGHELFSPFGPWLHTAGGTLTQLAAPLIGIAMFRRQGDWFAVSIGLAWLATNLFGIAVYMGDARARVLPLASPHTGVLSGEEARGLVGHDWEYLLGHAGLLHLDTTLAAGVHALGIATMGVGLALGGWLVARMIAGLAAR